MNNPDLQKWLLAPDGIATRLRALRGTTTGKTFADLAGMRASKLSKLELGQQTPTAADIHAIVAAAGQPTTIAAELEAKLAEMPTVQLEARINRFGQTAAQQRLNQLLANTGTLRLCETVHLPRPLQTLDYATLALTSAATSQGVKPEAKAAAAIVDSAAYLDDRSRQFQIVIAEPLLRWQVLPADLMRAQLQRILDVMQLPNVDLRILPLDQPLTVLPTAGFALTDTGGYTDTLEGATTFTDARLQGHTTLMDQLMSAAAASRTAAAIVASAIARTRQPAPVRFQ